MDSNKNTENTGNHAHFELSFVFPCLNEERTLAKCIDEVKASLEGSGIAFEIIVADNGSTDRSIVIAQEAGCRVVPVQARGYGAALHGGIEAAHGAYVMFADSDQTYLYSDALSLYKTCVEANADMAIASRMNGKIEPGAMPVLHRRLGTPVLTSLINLLFHGKLSDCNSGFRCVRKKAFESWEIRSKGMEFASELLIKALKAKAVMVEIPSGLRCGPVGRVAHLRTWRDGMRHLLFIFSEKPRLFELSGLLVAILATLLQTAAFFMGPVSLWHTFHIFDMHSQALFLLMGILGAQFYLFSCALYLKSADRPLGITRKLVHLDEGVLFFTLVALISSAVLMIAYITWQWSLSRFSNLNLAHELLFFIHALAVASCFSVGLLGIHILKKAGVAAPAPKV